MRCLKHSAWIVAVALALLSASGMAGRAQEAQRPAPAAPAAEPSPARPGLFDELGKLLQKPADLLPSFSRPEMAPPDVVQPPPPAPVAAQPTPSAPPPTVAEPPAPTRFFPGMTTGREICPPSANGAPDCQAGADKLCQSKGYKGGKSLSMDSSFGCSKRQARDGGGKPCGTEHFVTTAFCN